MKKHSRLVERVVRPYLIFIALILAVAMIVMYFSVVTKLNYEAENAGTKIAETMARQVDTYIEEIDVLAQQVKRQPRIINIFYNLNQYPKMIKVIFSIIMSCLELTFHLSLTD